MDVTSYLLGKKSSGGTDINEYFKNTGYIDNAGACIKKLPFDIDLTGISNCNNFFYDWVNLESVSFKNGGSVTKVYGMFNGCINLMFIDVRDIIFSNITSGSDKNIMLGNRNYGYVPSNCLIIVKDDTEKEWFTINFSTWTNVKTVAEYEAQQ